MPPAAVIVAPVKKELTQEQASVTGTLRALSKSDVAAQEAGAVASVLVDEGDEVSQKAPLAHLDDRRLKAQLVEAKANVTAAESLQEQRKAELQRSEIDLKMKSDLAPTKAVSKSDVLDAEKALHVAELQLKAASDGVTEAKSRADLLAIKLNDLEVKAPVAGVVIARHVEPGEWVAAGAPVATIVTIDPVEAWLRIPARYLGRTGSESKTFKVSPSATGKAFSPTKVTRVPEVDGRSQLFNLVATLSNPDRELTPGESVTGIVPIGQPADYLRIPLNAVVHSPQGTMIHVVQAPEGEGLPTGRPVPVQISFERDGSAFIAAQEAGFSENDQVIVEGNQRLMPGQSLMIKSPDQQGGPPAP